MKKYIWPSVKMTFVFIVICSVIYPVFIMAVSKLTPGKGNGETIKVNEKVVGYKLVGQKFTEDRYFNGRPSAVNYNAAGSGGSNKAGSNPDYVQVVKDRIDTFLAHNPGINKSEIPAELVTASGSGLDPDISPAGALVQAKRVAAARHLPEEKLRLLIADQTEKPLFGFLGPEKINLLKLNIALDALK